MKKISPRIFFIFSVFFFGGVINLIVWGVNGVLSYAVGAVCFGLIFLSLTLWAKSKIQDGKDTPQSFSQRLSLGLGASLSLYRIFSYALLVLALIGLIELDLFSLYAYMIGIFVSLSVLIYHNFIKL